MFFIYYSVLQSNFCCPLCLHNVHVMTMLIYIPQSFQKYAGHIGLYKLMSFEE
jgi:hypothetical protein